MVIWFNTWFSTIAWTIKSIKDIFPNTKIIGTNVSNNCAYRGFVDEFYIENAASPEDYVDWAIDFCKNHSIDIFFPKYYAKSISARIPEFEAIGVKVICEDYNTYTLFESKDAVYKKLIKQGYDKIPEYRVVSNVVQFIDAYKYYKNSGETVCCKFDTDEGASSFRVIDDEFMQYNSLSSSFENILSFDNMVSILRNSGRFKPLMVMPKLLSPEISVDCYTESTGEFVAIPRYKLGGRLKEIRFDKTIIEDCKSIQEVFHFKHAFNVQYRWNKSMQLKLLEINPRMSGGIHISSICGYSIPNQIVADNSGLHIKQLETFQSLVSNSAKVIKITQLETPIQL